MSIFTEPMSDWTQSKLAATLRQSQQPEELAAYLAREASLDRAQRVYAAALKQAIQAERVQEDIRQAQGIVPGLPLDEVAATVGTATVAIQPMNPTRELAAPLELSERQREFRVTKPERFPLTVDRLHTIPDGFLCADFAVRHCSLNCQQVYSNGLLYYRRGVTYRVRDKAMVLRVSDVLLGIVTMLRVARKFFPLVAHEDDLSCLATVENLQEYTLGPLLPRQDGYDSAFLGDIKRGLLPSYRFEATLSAAALRSDVEFGEFCASFLEQVCWGLGCETFGTPLSEQVRLFLSKNELLPSSQ